MAKKRAGTWLRNEPGRQQQERRGDQQPEHQQRRPRAVLTPRGQHDQHHGAGGQQRLHQPRQRAPACRAPAAPPCPADTARTSAPGRACENGIGNAVGHRRRRHRQHARRERLRLEQVGDGVQDVRRTIEEGRRDVPARGQQQPARPSASATQSVRVPGSQRTGAGSSAASTPDHQHQPERQRHRPRDQVQQRRQRRRPARAGSTRTSRSVASRIRCRPDPDVLVVAVDLDASASRLVGVDQLQRPRDLRPLQVDGEAGTGAERRSRPRPAVGPRAGPVRPYAIRDLQARPGAVAPLLAQQRLELVVRRRRRTRRSSAGRTSACWCCPSRRSDARGGRRSGRPGGRRRAGARSDSARRSPSTAIRQHHRRRLDLHGDGREADQRAVRAPAARRSPAARDDRKPTIDPDGRRALGAGQCGFTGAAEYTVSTVTTAIVLAVPSCDRTAVRALPCVDTASPDGHNASGDGARHGLPSPDRSP